MNQSSEPGFARVLSVRDGLAVTVGMVIGAGILRAPGEIAGLLEKLALDYPKLSIGSYPFVKNGKLGVDIVINGDSSEIIDQFINNFESMIEELKGDEITEDVFYAKD